MGITNEQKAKIKSAITEFIVSGKTNHNKYIPVLLKIENKGFSESESVFIDEIETLVRRLVPAKDVCWIVGGIEEKETWMGLAIMNGPTDGKDQFIVHDLPYKFLITVK